MTSNRHWPNLFKSKPSTSQHQWHQMTTSSNISGPNLSSNEGTSSREEEREREKEKEKERNPDPKLRWNPKPEQIRILESIFNSGMVNPPREEIQKIRMQLEVYGQVGDASVSYWFHNRKSRTKQKQRHLQASAEKSSKSSATGQSCFDQYGVTLPNNNTSSFIGELPSSLLPCSASFPMQYLGYQQTEGINTAQYLNMEVAQMWNEGTSCTGNIHGMSNIPQNQQTYSSFLYNEGQAYPPYVDHHAAAETFKPHQNLLSPPLNDSTIIHSGAESRVSSSNASSFTVFINDIPINVPMGPINNNTNSFIGELPSSLLPCSASFPMQYLGYQQTEGINTAQYLNMEVAQMWNEGTSCTGNIHGMSNIPQNQQTYSSFLHNEGQAYPPYVDHHAGAETFKPHQNLLSPPLNDSTIIHSGAESRVSSSNASSFTVFINDIPIDVPMGPINNNTNSFIGELPSSLLPCSASFPMQYLGYQQTEGINTAQYLNMEVAQMWNEGTSCTGNIHGMSNIPQNQQTYSSFLHNEGQAYPPYVDHHAGAETFKPHQNLLSPPLNDSTIIHSGAESRVSSSNASSFTVFINDIPIDVPMGPINVKALFGPNAVLFHYYGQPVIMDEQGFTLQALQQGAMYYLMQI